MRRVRLMIARLRWLAAPLFLQAVLAPPARAAAQHVPVSLIITYRAKPEARAAFRRYMESSGVQQLESWKRKHVFRAYTLLFSAYAAAAQPSDMTLLLSFDHYADTAKWMKIEQSMPGGLAPEALAMAVPQTSTLADEVMDKHSPDVDSRSGVFMLLPYVVAASASEYKSYAAGYIEPQLRGWMQRGVLAGYRLYVNQNAAGAEWSSLLVLEYANAAALGERETVKNAVRQDLARSDPAWLAYSKRKTTLRTEKAAVIATEIVP